MSDTHFELTGETTEVYRATLHRIRATQDLPEHSVRAGEVGGWIEHPRNIRGLGWVAGSAAVRDQAVVWGLVAGQAQVRDHAEVWDGAAVTDTARVAGWGQAHTGAVISGSGRVLGECAGRVTSCGLVPDRAVVGRTARLRGPQDVLVLGPVGSEDVWVTLWRTETGHGLRVGCWSGQVDQLAAEVDDRAGEWDCSAEDEARWRAEYAAVETLCRARIAGWGES